MAARNPLRDFVRRILLQETAYGDTHDRYEIFEPMNLRPLLNADYAPATPNAAEITRAIAGNKNFEVQGTNAASADIDFDATGGVSLVTAGADNDQVVMVPQADNPDTGVEFSSMAKTAWGTEDEVRFEANIRTAAIDNSCIWVGLKLAATTGAGEADTAAVLTHGDNGAFFMFSDEGATSTTNWTTVTSIGGTDSEEDAGSAYAVAASTNYRLTIHIGSDRKPRFYINGTLVRTGAALTDDVDLVPVLGIHALDTGAESFVVRSVRISRLLAVN